MSRTLAAAIALALPLAPLGAQQPAAVDWHLAVATFAANRADGSHPPTGKGASRCAGYWTAHVGALTRKAFPPEALAGFDAELTSGDEASLNALTFSQLTTDGDEYLKRKDEAAAMLARLLAGDRESLVAYFRQLARCSMGPG
jgi:hypothetical protein